MNSVRRSFSPVFLIAACLSTEVVAQAPASADLWRLSAASLAGPAALETGALAGFWNPAGQASDVRIQAGVQVLQTPDILGVSALMAGFTYRFSRALTGGVVVGRTDVGDLVRTSTSPTSELGAIPVYEQLIGVGVALHRGPFTLGVLARGHNARFDALRDDGVTLDAGVRFGVRRWSLAAASHFFPLNLTGRELTDYYGGASYWLASPRIWGSPGRLFVRYGISAREAGPQADSLGGTARAGAGVEHGGGAGLELSERFRLDASLVREQGYGDVAWRPTVGVQFRIGRYAIAASRASGVRGVGGSYRIGLDVDVIR